MYRDPVRYGKLPVFESVAQFDTAVRLGRPAAGARAVTLVPIAPLQTVAASLTQPGQGLFQAIKRFFQLT